MIGIFALTACGPACWEAKDDVCRCSCGGAHHGIHRNKNQSCADLKRQMVYGGFIFELRDVAKPIDRGSGIFGPDTCFNGEARELNEQAGIKFYFAHTSRNHFGEFPVAIVRTPTDAQIAKWPELAEWRGKVSPLYGKPSILWVRRDDITQAVAQRIGVAA